MAEDLDDAQDSDAKETKKKSGGLLVPMLFGLVLAMALGIGAAIAVMTGVAPIPGLETAEEDGAEEREKAKEEPEAKVVFVELDELRISIGRDATARTLSLKISIETTEPYVARVEEYKPRMLDALTTLLRASDARDLIEPVALARLRAQMLRRVRLAADPTSIRDLLVTEYVVF